MEIYINFNENANFIYLSLNTNSRINLEKIIENGFSFAMNGFSIFNIQIKPNINN